MVESVGQRLRRRAGPVPGGLQSPARKPKPVVEGPGVVSVPGRERGESGTMSLELVLLVPVLVLLTLFVLWAGRGGRAALTADLAAEEAATAAAYCCEEEAAGDADREALAEDFLAARPGLEFLCVGGLRPGADPDPDTPGGPSQFVREEWVEFEPGRMTGGVGVLGVRFTCETDGAVAPMRGLFPTVTFHGQASEVVLRQARSVVGFKQGLFTATEGVDAELVFVVRALPARPDEVTLRYLVDEAETTIGAEDLCGVAGIGEVSGSVVIPAGDDSAEIRVPLAHRGNPACVDDVLYEGDESLFLDIVEAFETVGGSQVDLVVDPEHMRAEGRVEDDDPAPHVCVSGPSPSQVVEGGTPGPGTLTFQVRLRDAANAVEAPSAAPVEVDVRTVDGTAVAGDDYHAVSMVSPDDPVTFAPGEHTVDIEVVTIDDDASPEPEDTETFKLVASNAVGAALCAQTGAREAVGTILDDEATLSVADASVVEGNDPGVFNELVFELSLDKAASAPVVVQYELQRDTRSLAHAATAGDDCAAAGVDYLWWDDPIDPGTFTSAGTVTITTRAQQVSLPGVRICGDRLVEHAETLWLVVAVIAGEAVVPEPELPDPPREGRALGTIKNDDDIPVIVVEPAAATGTEGTECGTSTHTLVFTVSLEGRDLDGNVHDVELEEDITVGYTVGGGTAVAPGEPDADYTVAVDGDPPDPGALDGTLTFNAAAPGMPAITEHSLVVELRADYLVEDPETLRLDLHTLEDPTGAAEFADRDADPGTDDSHAVATIVDCPPPALTVDSVGGREGDTVTFTVTLADPRGGETVTVPYSLVGGTGAGEAAAGDDFEPVDPALLTGGTLTFGPAVTDTAQTVAVSLLHDTVDEAVEEFRLELGTPTGAVLADSDPDTVGDQFYGVGTILDVEPPGLVVDNPRASEGYPLTFTVTLCRPRSGEDVTVTYDVSEYSADEGLDFEAVPQGMLEFLDSLPVVPVADVCGTGQVAAKSLTVDVATLNDTKLEKDETLWLTLSEPKPEDHIGLDKAIGVGTIVDFKPATVRVTNPTAVEGDPLGFVISLTDARGDPATITAPVTVYYATADGTADSPPADPYDYTPVPAAPGPCLVAGPPPAGCPYVTFGTADNPTTANPDPPGRRHRVPVPTITDTLDEDDETVALVLTLAAGTTNAGLGDTEGTGTIEDRPPPRLLIDDAAAEEGGTMTFEVVLVDAGGVETPTSRNVTVFAATEDGTAAAGADYTTASRRLTIPAGQTRASFPFEVVTRLDDDDEPPETLRVVLSGPENARIGIAIAIGTINPRCVHVGLDDADNRPPTITVHPASAREGDAFRVPVSFSRPLCDPFRLTYRLLSGTADVYSDFRLGTLGDTRHRSVVGGTPSRLTVWHASPIEDNLHEGDEWYTIEVSWSAEPDVVNRITMPDHYQGLGGVSAPMTIIDNDDPPRLHIADSSAEEGDAISFDITLDRPSGLPVTVQYRTVPASGTATGGSDYTEVDWTPEPFVTFAPGETSKTFDVATQDDGPGDSGETFLVEVRAPVSPDPANPAPPLNARMQDGVAVGTILEVDLPEMRIEDARGDEDAPLRFRVTLSETAAQPISVQYRTEARPPGLGAATEGSDYTAVSGPLDFGVGDAEMTIEVPVADDGADEVDETFWVQLSNPNGASLADGRALGTINGDVTCVDASEPGAIRPVVSSSGAGEGDGHMVFTVQLSQPLCQAYRLTAHWNSGVQAETSAIYAHDFEWFPSNYGEILIPALATEASFRAVLIDDEMDEPDEELQLYGTVGSDNYRWYATGTIFDDDEAYFSVSDASGGEGGYLNFVIRLDRPVSRTTSVAYGTEDTTPPSAEAGTDYRARTGSVRIPSPEGLLSASVAVFAPQDGLDEHNETFLLRLRNPTGQAELADADAVATGMIVDDDEPPNVRVSNASAGEGEDLVFEVTLDVPSGRRVSVPVATRDDTATAADRDYVPLASNAAAVFEPGVTRQTVRVRTLADSVVESSETVWVDLGPMRDGTAAIDKASGRGEIRDVSDRRVSVSDASVVEGGTLAFEVGFSEGPSGRDVTVRYQTRGVTAAAGDDYADDYESVSRELKIVAGASSATVLVPTVPDTLDEDNETLELVLSDPDGAVVVGGAAAGVIIDDDPEPVLSVGDTEASEADGATAVFTLSLSEASGRDVTVTYSTDDITAVARDDYTPTPASGATQTITAGQTGATVDVALVNDDVAEVVETFQLVVSSVENAGRGDSIGVATITDDDGLVQILVDDPDPVYEGDGASVVFTVRLSRADGADAVTVDYSTVDGTAIAGDDYSAVSDTLIFGPDETTRTVTVALVNDAIVEHPEAFRLVLGSPSVNAELGDGEATVLVLDDDGLPTLSVTDAAAATEGSTASFAVTLSRASPQEVTVAYAAVVDPTAADEAAATPGLDYTAVSDTVAFAARATSATVTVPLLGDSFDEHTETFWLRLSSPTAATIVDGTATGTITDDDPLPELSIIDASATEGSPLGFEVRLTPASGRTVTVPWTTEARPAGVDAASPGTDYTAASGIVTFVPGASSARFEVESLPDIISEADETFLVQLGTPVNAALDDGLAAGAIRDDDGLPRVSVADTTVDEDDGPATFAVTLSHPSSRPVTVAYTTADGTADSPPADPHDYAPDEDRTLTLPATFTEGEISVFINDDDLAEGTETFTFTLTNPVNAVIAEGAATATGTILDDDGQPRLSIADAEECENGASTADCQVRNCRAGSSFTTYEQYLACQAILDAPGACQPDMCAGDGIIEFLVQLSHASTTETSVRYTTFAGDAASPGDYIATIATLTIPAGQTSASIPVVLVDDGIDELQTETFRLRLDNPVGVELATEEASGTILDDDPPPRVAAEPFDAFSNENDGFAYHRVTLSHPSALTVTVDYRFEAVNNRSGTPGIDTTPGTLTFAPGVVEQTLEVPLFDNDVSTYAPQWIWPHANTSYRPNLSNRVNASGGLGVSTGVVWDDETPPYVESVAAQDTLESAGGATFTITLNRFSDTAVTATYQTVDGTAAAGSDYTAAEATVTFPPGTITATVTVVVLDDTDVEDDEAFTLRIIDDPRNSNLTYLASPLHDGRGTGSGSVLIIDDDTLPEISVTDTEANENAGTMPLWVSLSRASATDVTVRYATADGTATAGSDYTAADDTLTIEAGAVGAPVPVTIIDDTDDTESDETFELNLSNANGATITDTSATATIIEDANLPTMTLHDESRSENIGQLSRHMYFAFSLSRPLTRTMTIDWQVVEVPSLGDEAATLGADFFGPSATNGVTTRSPTSGEFRVGPRRFGNSVSNLGSFSFTIVADMVPERDERFQVILSNPRGVTLGNTRAWGTIVNDDLPIVSVADMEASESDDAVVFTLQLHEPGLDPASLHYTTVVRASEGAAAASPGEDYTTASGILDIPVGATTATISVPILGDTADEPDETFLLVLSNPDNLEFRDRVAVGTIVDDDPGFWIDDPSVWENAAVMYFTVRRDHTSAGDVAVDYRIGAGGSAVGGIACTDDGVDFVWPSGTSASGTVTMAAARTSTSIGVTVCDDDEAEGRESLLIELTNVTGRKTTGVGTIVDDDRTDLPRINISDSASRTEGVHDAVGGATFTISADGPLTDTVQVGWRTENCLDSDTHCPHPAAEGADYITRSGNIFFTPAGTSATVTVPIVDDDDEEDDEQFFVRLRSVTGPAAVGSGATHTDPVGIGTILNDDDDCIDPRAAPDPLDPPTLTAPPTLRVNEGDPLNIILTLSPAGFCRSLGIEVRFGAAGDTAEFGSDYTAPSQQGAWSGLFRQRTTSVVLYGPSAVDDDIAEGDETFTFEATFCGRLGSLRCSDYHPDYADRPSVTVIVTIVDDDLPT